MDMNIVWVHRLGPQMASYRYRAQIPADEVAQYNGFKTSINEGDADVVVFSKPLPEDLEVAEKAKSEGTKIVVDMGDDHFTDIEAPTYHKFAGIADAIVTASNVMRGRIYDYTKRDAVVIPDPYEQEEVEPHAEGDDFLWFGHVRNFPEIQSVLHLLGDRKLRLVSGPKEMPQVIPWSPQNINKAFRLSNIVLLPTKQGSEYKSPNRLLNSIRAGCFPVCMTHPAYLEFQHMVWVGHFPTGLKWIEAFKSDLNGLVKEAQDYIRDRYSPREIGKQWAKFLGSI